MKLYRGLDDQFGVGTRDEGGGRDQEIEAPELPVAEQDGSRHPRRPARGQPLEMLLLARVDVPWPPAQQTGQIDTQHMGEQDTRFAMRLGDAGRAEDAGRALKRVLDRPCHASAEVKLARRAA